MKKYEKKLTKTRGHTFITPANLKRKTFLTQSGWLR